MLRRLVFLLGAILGCGTDPEPPATPHGSFAGSDGDDEVYLSLTLDERDGSVSGASWMAFGSLATHVVTGTFTAPELRLELRSDANGDQQPDNDNDPLELAGTLERDVFTATLSAGPDFQLDLQLARVDTTAAARYEWSAEGAVTASQRGVAGFTVPHGLELQLSPGGPDDGILLGGRRGRPGVGRYPIGLDTASAYSAWFLAEEPLPFGRLFQAVSGELTIEVSTPRILIGSFRFTADDVDGSGGRVTVTGSYSAGCGSVRCE